MYNTYMETTKTPSLTEPSQDVNQMLLSVHKENSTRTFRVTLASCSNQ